MPRPSRSRRKRPAKHADGRSPDDAQLRIIGGHLRGSKLRYSGDPRTRPMKDRLREAVFNLLGPAVRGKHAIDLFAGTGALGLEAISRGAISATLIERHLPTVEIIRQNVRHLDLADRVEVAPVDTFVWATEQLNRQTLDLPPEPWLVFCSPPYSFYVERSEEMLDLVQRFVERAPTDSLITVESDLRFDASRLPRGEQWDVRTYRPAQVAIFDKLPSST